MTVIETRRIADQQEVLIMEKDHRDRRQTTQDIQLVKAGFAGMKGRRI
jgi:hypothetical protein